MKTRLQPSPATRITPATAARRSAEAASPAEQQQRAEWLQRLCAYTGTLGLGIGTICCFFFGHLVWAFTCNVYHSAWTLLLTVVGIVAIRRGEAASFNLMSGIFLAMAGITYFPAGLRDLQRTYMNTNWAMTGIHFVIAGIQLSMYVMASRLERTAAAHLGAAGARTRVPPRAFAFGAILTALGIGGCLTDHVGGVLRVNLQGAFGFLSLGAAGILAALDRRARGFALVVGVFCLGLGLFDVVPALHAAQVGFFGFNAVTTGVLIVLGAAALATYGWPEFYGAPTLQQPAGSPRGRALRLSVALVLTAGALSTPADGAHHPDDAAKCIHDGLGASLRAFVPRAERLLYVCSAKARAGAVTTDCAADALAEAGSKVRTPGFAGRFRRLIEGLQATLASACAGPDGRPYTADDVTPERLGSEGGADGVHMIADCLPMEAVDVWMRRPGLQRLIELHQCIALSQALGRVQEQLGVADDRMTAYRVRIVPPALLLDGGADALPLQARDGVNDLPNLPVASGCIVPGFGTCADDGDPSFTSPMGFCSLAPGEGIRIDPVQCPRGPTFACVERLVGPDGVTPGDIPQGSLATGEFIALASPTEPPAYGEFEIRCLLQGVRDAAGNLVTTSFAGSCSGGPKDGSACASSADCDDELPARFLCLSGDEYTCAVEGASGTNHDDVPACAECGLLVQAGPPQQGCGLPGEGICAASTCEGGDRDGQICDLFGISNCPGGTCTNIGRSFPVTGDEAAIYMPAFGGQLVRACSVRARWDLPVDLVDGTGWVVTRPSRAPLHMCLPGSHSIEVLNLYVREPTANGTNTVLAFGLYPARPSAQSIDNQPCPVSVPLARWLTGWPLVGGVGPIIGVAGVTGS